MGEVCNRKQCSLFSFSHVGKKQILKEILNLDLTKTSQDTDIPTKSIQDNADIFSDFLLSGFNKSIPTSIFPSKLKQTIITPVFKKGDKNSKESYRLVSYYIANSSLNKFQISLRLSCQNSVVFVKATAHSIAFCP